MVAEHPTLRKCLETIRRIHVNPTKEWLLRDTLLEGNLALGGIPGRLNAKILIFCCLLHRYCVTLCRLLALLTLHETLLVVLQKAGRRLFWKVIVLPGGELCVSVLLKISWSSINQTICPLCSLLSTDTCTLNLEVLLFVVVFLAHAQIAKSILMMTCMLSSWIVSVMELTWIFWKRLTAQDNLS